MRELRDSDVGRKREMGQMPNVAPRRARLPNVHALSSVTALWLALGFCSVTLVKMGKMPSAVFYCTSLSPAVTERFRSGGGVSTLACQSFEEKRNFIQQLITIPS